MEARICRFCFEEQEIHNPLLSPCACKGSMEFVHARCIRTWRRTTKNPHYLVQCQFCKTNYTLPNMLPVECVPEYEPFSMWILLRQSYAIWCVSYIQYSFSYVWLLQLYRYVFQTMGSPILFQKIIYSITIGTIAYIFGSYFSYHISHIRNRTIYMRYWLAPYLSSHPYESPRTILQMLVFSFVLAPHFPTPFYTLYIMTLCKLPTTHFAILEQINSDNT